LTKSVAQFVVSPKEMIGDIAIGSIARLSITNSAIRKTVGMAFTVQILSRRSLDGIRD